MGPRASQEEVVLRGSQPSILEFRLLQSSSGFPKPRSKQEFWLTQDTFYEPTGGLHKVEVRAHLPWVPCRELTAPDCARWTGRGNKVEKSRTCLHLLYHVPSGQPSSGRQLEVGVEPQLHDSTRSLIFQVPLPGLLDLGAPGWVGQNPGLPAGQ